MLILFTRCLLPLPGWRCLHFLMVRLRAIVKEKITELGATNPAMMGQIIGAVKQAAGNAADGAVVAQIVKQELN